MRFDRKVTAVREAPLAFSNDDLERMFGAPEPAPDAAAPAASEGLPKLPDPLAEVSDWQAQRTAAELRRRQAASRVAELESEVRDLDAREAAVRNPLLPRPEPPPGIANWGGMSGTERVAALQARLAELRSSLAQARKDLATAEAEARSAEAGRVETAEMDRVFNMGVGMIAVTARDQAGRVIDQLRAAGEAAWLLGEVVEGEGVRYA